eukprot:5628205-Heterocapsa_arctica.AAC.1
MEDGLLPEPVRQRNTVAGRASEDPPQRHRVRSPRVDKPRAVLPTPGARPGTAVRRPTTADTRQRPS